MPAVPKALSLGSAATVLLGREGEGWRLANSFGRMLGAIRLHPKVF